MSGSHGRTWAFLLSGGLALMACRGSETVAPVADGEPAKRAASSFVHCVEAGSSRCIRNDPALKAWDAFAMLGWLAAGSPSLLAEGLDATFLRHQSLREIESSLVRLVELFQPAVRGAECDPIRSERIDLMMPRLEQQALERLGGLGLLTPDLRALVSGLVAEATQGLGSAFVVTLACKSDPYALYLGTTASEGRQLVVGWAVWLPGVSMAESATREALRARLESRSLGLANASAPLTDGIVHPFVPVPLEVF